MVPPTDAKTSLVILREYTYFLLPNREPATRQLSMQMLTLPSPLPPLQPQLCRIDPAEYMGKHEISQQTLFTAGEDVVIGGYS